MNVRPVLPAFVILAAAVVCVAAGVQMASALTPPSPKPLAERVNLASHIFVGTAKKLWVTDANGKQISPEPKSLGLDQGAWVLVEVKEVLRPKDWKVDTNFVFALPHGFFAIQQLPSGLLDKELIYVTITDGKTFGPAYGWNLTEPLDRKAQIESLLSLTNQSSPPTKAAASPTEESAVILNLFNSLGEGRTVIQSTNLPARPPEQVLVNWLRASDAKIRRLTEAGNFSVVLSKVSPTNQNSYALRRFSALNTKTVLDTNKVYLQIQVIPFGLACPEYHGIVDPNPPKLLSFWGEGG